jgi:hypothetical protein
MAAKTFTDSTISTGRVVVLKGPAIQSADFAQRVDRENNGSFRQTGEVWFCLRLSGLGVEESGDKQGLTSQAVSV